MKRVAALLFVCSNLIWSSPAYSVTQSAVLERAAEASYKARKASEKISTLHSSRRMEYQFGPGWYYGQGQNYTGTMTWGYPSGVGRLTYNDNESGGEWFGNVYEGQWKKYSDGSYFDGYGVYVFNAEGPWKGSRYEGEWKKGHATRWGIHFWPNGEEYHGYFESMVLDREKRVMKKNGIITEGVPSEDSVVAEEKADSISDPLADAEANCIDIGFTKGTEKFGDCVMRLMPN